MPMHGGEAPSPWVLRFLDLLPPAGRVLDLACGAGRHVRTLSAAGHRVTAVDRDDDALAGLRDVAETIVADLEDGPWPLPDRLFDGVIVTNYLHRPLLPLIGAAVAEGGILIYETFAQGNERFGRPRNPDFLLRPGELLALCRDGLRAVAYEHGLVTRGESQAVIQRLCAARTEEPRPLTPRP